MSNSPDNPNNEILKTFERLQKIDKNAAANLKKLADMAEKNPAKYFFALTFLK